MRKLLIVDDSPNLRRLWVRLLEASGLPFDGTVEAGNGRQALELLAKDASIAMALVDGHMPEMDGAAFVQFVRAQETGEQHLPIVIVATEGGEEIAARALALGADRCLRKPFSAHGLRAAMEIANERAA